MIIRNHDLQITLTIKFARALNSLFTTSRINWLLATAGFGPLLLIFSIVLWKHPAYQFFPLALLAGGILAWRAIREEKGPFHSGPSLQGRLLAAATILTFLAANALWSPWLNTLSFLLFLATWLWHKGGSRLLRAGLPALIMWGCIIPPPFGWDDSLMLWLRGMAVDLSSCLLDAFGIIHALQGNTIVLPGKTLLVAEACSGINSVVLCGALCLFYVMWRQRSLTRLIIMLPTVWMFVMLGNVFRITFGAWLYARWQVNWLSGNSHEFFGLVLLFGYVVLVISLDEMLEFLAHSQTTDEPEETELKARHEPSVEQPAILHSHQAFRHWGLVLATVGIGIFAARMMCGNSLQAVTLLPELGKVRDLKLSLPAKLAGWQQINDGPDNLWAETLGVRSVVWHFARNGTEAVVAVDYPLEGFHDVKVCYQNNGWGIISRQRLTLNASSSNVPVFEDTMERSGCEEAVVLHAVFNEQGRWLLPRIHKSHFAVRLFGSDPVTFQASYRIQVLAGGYMPVSSAVKTDTRELFSQACEILYPEMMHQFQAPKKS